MTGVSGGGGSGGDDVDDDGGAGASAGSSAPHLFPIVLGISCWDSLETESKLCRYTFCETCSSDIIFPKWGASYLNKAGNEWRLWKKKLCGGGTTASSVTLHLNNVTILGMDGSPLAGRYGHSATCKGSV